MGVYDSFRKALSPPWLRKARGDAWNEANGAVEDEQLRRLVESARVRHPSFAPEAALALIGEDRGLPRGPGESRESYAARLGAAIQAWRWAGTEKGLLEYGLRPMGYTSLRIIVNREWQGLADGGRIPDGDASRWARFWLICGRPPAYSSRSWTEQSLRGFRETDTFGTDATRDQAILLKRVIDQWRPAHALCVGAWMVLGDATALTLDSRPDDANWLEENVTFNGGTPAAFWRFAPPIQLTP